MMHVPECFNSKLVRLKVAYSSSESVSGSSFNSKLVRLKVSHDHDDGGMSEGFNSKLVRLKVADVPPLPSYSTVMFQFQTGSIKSNVIVSMKPDMVSFNSKLVRLKGFPNTALILYCTLTVPVKLIFILIRLEGSLLSTSNRANSIGG